MKFAAFFLAGLVAFAAQAEAKWVKTEAGPSLAVAEARCAPQSGLSNTEAFLYGGMLGLAYNTVKNDNRKAACMATYGWTQQRGKKPGKTVAAKPAVRKTNFSAK